MAARARRGGSDFRREREREGGGGLATRARVDSEQNHVTTPSALIGYIHTHTYAHARQSLQITRH